MPVIKAVLFDLDDTLWPIAPVIERAEKVLYEWLSFHAPNVVKNFTLEALRKQRLALMQENPHYQLNLSALRHAGLVEAFKIAGEDIAKVELAMTIFSQARNTVTLFEDVVPGLRCLQNRFVLGSISNGMADLNTIGLAHYFTTSLTAYSFGKAKPDSTIFHAACNALGMHPSEVAYVGDDLLLDVEGAQKAGLHGVWMKRFYLEDSLLLSSDIKPDAICTTLHELNQWLTVDNPVAPVTVAR